MTFTPHDTPNNISGPEQGADEKTYCTVHPTVETGLKCNKCGRYMCIKCAVRTPVGYRCKQCVNQQQDSFFNATTTDYVVAAAVSFVISLPVSFIMVRTFIFLVIIVGLPVGAAIGQIVLRATGKRRGRYSWVVAIAGIAVGTLVSTLPLIQPYLVELSDRSIPSSLVMSHIVGVLIVPLIFVALCSIAAMSRLRFGK